MTFHLDTDICIAALKGHTKVADKVLNFADRVAISSIVLAELYCGVFHSLNDFIAALAIEEFGTKEAIIYGRLCADLLRIGKPTGEKDALIAAVALRHGATLVTHNTRHYANIKNLKLEDWLT
jgi:tRNA(fMet)-specific endonuclease VapC